MFPDPDIHERLWVRLFISENYRETMERYLCFPERTQREISGGVREDSQQKLLEEPLENFQEKSLEEY